MKITFIHGSDVESARSMYSKFVNGIKKSNWEANNVDDRIDQLNEVLAFKSLFDSNVVVATSKGKKISTSTLKNLNMDSEANMLVLYEGSAPKGILNLLPKNTNIEEYNHPKLVFNFLDSVLPGSSEHVLKLLHQLRKTEQEEFIAAMLSRHLRDLYWSLVDPESLTYPGWRKTKLISQASKLGETRLVYLIKETAASDYKSKTSKHNSAAELDSLILGMDLL